MLLLCAIFLTLKLVNDTLFYDGHDGFLQRTAALIHTTSRLNRRMLLAKAVAKETGRLAVPRRQTLLLLLRLRKLVLRLCEGLRIRSQMGLVHFLSGLLLLWWQLLFIRRKASWRRVVITAAAGLRCKNYLWAGGCGCGLGRRKMIQTAQHADLPLHTAVTLLLSEELLGDLHV